MAVLNKIRQRSLFLILIIALALFSFVLTDLFRNSDALFGGSQDVVATVNGTNINRTDFMNRVEQMQSQLGPNSTSTQAMSRVYDQEVRKAIMASQFENLGLSVEQDQMKDLLKQSFSSYPEFQNEAGVFDENKLTEFVNNLKTLNGQSAPLSTFQINYQQWVSTENNIALGAQERAYFAMVKAGVNATLGEAEVDYMLENATRDLNYVQVPFTSIADSLVDVSKADITKYIGQHKDKYEVDATRDISFVEFKEVASVEDEENLKTELLKLLDDKVLFNEATNANETIIGLRNTKDIESFVNSNSDITYNDAFLSKSQLPSVAADTIYNTNVGGIYGPYKDAGFYKLSKVVAETQLPDSVKVRHILVPYAGAQSAQPTVTATLDEARSLADSIKTVVTVNPSKFPELVTEFSSDQGSVANGGEYDFHPITQMVKPFSDFEFQNQIGDIGVVQTVFGFHIIEILDQKNKSRAIKVATIAREIEPSEKTIDATFTEASKFELALQKESYDDAAKERNFTAKPVNGIKVLDENIPGLGSQRTIVRWAFEDGTKVGDYKRFSIPSGGYAVVQVVKATKKGLMDAESASATVLSEIRNEKKAAMILDGITGTTVADIAKNQGRASSNASAVNMKNPTLSGAGAEPKVVGAAFGLEEGGVSKPIVGNKGVYVVEVTKINEATSLDNYQAIANRLSTARTNAAQTKVYEALKETADIDDNRARFF
ncbi:peptidylprolyl isomerase [Psychroserpens ponticola]|uniref:Periplasmic chaperone PpiD n=1 Tax=Psychroserpens ponticola TaxID=2932268 RepID=A0ABY7RWH1_9FLAO|nr:SurA N-terminal domain-containing protein [Psychroserpens ponticola]WCO01183.1 SurA N-terminal domain-containing protein [Psychroserpens ponticola]